MFKYDRTLNHRDQKIGLLDKIVRIYRTTAFVLDFCIQNCYNTNGSNGGTKREREFTIDNRGGLLRRKIKYGWRFIMNSGKIPAKTENVRKIWLLGLTLMIIGLGGSNVFALDLMGPPVTELEKGMFRGGIDYSSSTMDLELIEGNATIYRNGELYGQGIVESLTIEDFKVNTLYANVGYGVAENYEVFLRMGAANATFGDSLWEESEEFDNKYNFAISAGAKATFYEGFDWKIGGIFQINLTELDGEIDSSARTITQPQFVEISSTEMQIAIGAKYMRTGWLSLYGGPFLHFISGDFDYTFTRITDLYFDTGEYSWEFNEGPTYGGYIGAQIEIAKNFFANIEYQQTSNADVIGANIMMRY